MADIFVSYADEDRERAQVIVKALEAQKLTVFWDRKLVAGETYRQVLAKELVSARCVLVLWSQVSVISDWVIDEADEGKKGGRLVSVRIDDVRLPLGFRQIQAVTLVGWSGEAPDENFQLLLEGVRNFVPVRPPVRDPERPPVPLPPVEETKPPTLPPQPERHGWLEAFAQHVTRHKAFEPTLLLGVVFVLNLLETRFDALFTPLKLGADAGYPIAEAFRWFERNLSFESHDTVGAIAIVGTSLSYFLLFPVICVLVAWALARRSDPVPYQTISLGVAINYVISLPFFLFFPVPERWTFPATDAMLLSDKLSDRLIEIVRPISGLDNCFPSFHVSLMTLAVAACFMFDVPLRRSILAIGMTVVLATFILGIHWIPDMLAGFAAGGASLLLAYRFVRRGRFQIFQRSWAIAN
jgi:membrane-associated phospholipid phosphatase